MADAVKTNVLFNSPNKHVVQILSLSDGTGESAVIKVDKSTLTGNNGLEPTELRIDKIEGDCVGMDVLLYADHTTDVIIARLGGVGRFKRDFRDIGGLHTSGAGDTGDITLTTTGHSAGDSYDIVIYMTKID